MSVEPLDLDLDFLKNCTHKKTTPIVATLRSVIAELKATRVEVERLRAMEARVRDMCEGHYETAEAQILVERIYAIVNPETEREEAQRLCRELDQHNQEYLRSRGLEVNPEEVP